MNSPIGVYIHVPFCRQKCPYCDFYSKNGSAAEKERYADAVVRALNSFEGGVLADTVYFGGGTPTLLGTAALCRILQSLPTTKNAEITLEANPTTVTQSNLEQLVAAGFNRISFGVQSTHDAILQTLGRTHSTAQARSAVFAAKAAGFNRISVDLMLAVPNQTLAHVLADVAEIAAWPVEHVSAYLLKLEAGTPFYSRYDEPDEALSADLYLAAVAALEQHGFAQYEISNFAKSPAAQSRHNLKYWHCEEYLGVGPAAHSMVGGKRFYFPRDLEGFVQSPNVWQAAQQSGEGGSDEERLMLALRLTEGVACNQIAPEKHPLIHRLCQNGKARIENDRFCLTPEGFLISNGIIAALI